MIGARREPVGSTPAALERRQLSPIASRRIVGSSSSESASHRSQANRS